MLPPPLLTVLNWVLLLALSLPVAAGQGKRKGNGKGKGSNSHGPEKDICTLLTHHLPPSQVHLPSSPSYPSLTTYWSTRQSSHPSCFVLPHTTGQVSTLLRLLTHHNTPFTVKAGGHTPFSNGSSISSPGSVVIDVSQLNNNIIVSSDRQTVTLGPGLRWANVSEVLDPLGLAVVGGRTASVGVAGLVLGGGISYFSGRRGWACDNVKAYEVVLANGRVVRATAHENKDLYWALRGGGGSNFGIVTRFELAAYEQGPMWASRQLFPGATNHTLIPLMHDLLVDKLPADPDAHTWFVMLYVPEFGGHVVISDQFHATHANLSTPPAAFAAFHDTAAAPEAILTDTRLASVGRLLIDADSPAGSRQTWWTTSIKATTTTDTPALLMEIERIYSSWHAPRLFDAAANGSAVLVPGLIFQAISTNVLQAMQVNGGNALGLKPEDGPLMIVQLTVQWTDPALDDVVEATCGDTIRRIDALAASRGARSKNGFIYMNYAGKGQDVLAGYGKSNRERLRKIAKKYDPEGKLNKLWKGYFKA
ncbi:hypothetical protein VTJ49DRAFT_460 [Mycothermus thermophilus]|uniref:FAD-binding PCMH-type domain-containing protein n=1 Tax=Humicola insolens TaxID=85995 RepID=A0ABR3VFL9_HUMIN